MKKNTVTSVVGFVLLWFGVSQCLAGDRVTEEYHAVVNNMPMIRSSAESMLRYIITGSGVDDQTTVIDNNAIPAQSVVLSLDGRIGTVSLKEIMKKGMNITVMSGSKAQKIAKLYSCLIEKEQDCISLVKDHDSNDKIKCMSDEEQGRGNTIYMCIDTKADNRVVQCVVY